MMQKTLHLKIKYRESFRPFAPSVLRENVADWFEMDSDSPYMLLCADVVKNRRRQRTRSAALWEPRVDVLVAGNCYLSQGEAGPRAENGLQGQLRARLKSKWVQIAG
jgi:predicted NodU family carbamoyl transferase